MRTHRQRSASAMGAALVAVFALASVVVVGSVLAASEDLPAFRQGMWKYSRTVAGRLVESSRCSDPTADLIQQNARMQKAGCTFTPVRKSGNTYTFEANCSLKMPRGGTVTTVTSQTKTVMTVESDSAYRLEVTGTQDGAPVKETLVASRTGDCSR